MPLLCVHLEEPDGGKGKEDVLFPAQRERGDTPTASSADALVSPSGEGLVVMLGDEKASVSPAREG
jgi:hypothetical protein